MGENLIKKEEINENKVFTKSDLMKQLSDYLAKDKPEGYKIGLDCIDNLIRFETGKVCIIQGIPQSGKSEIIDFFNIRLNRLYGWKCVYFSPENYPTGVYHLQKLLCKYRQEYVSISNMITETYENDINYLTNNFYFINYEVVYELSTILKEAEKLIDKEKAKVLTLDPFNRIKHLYTGFNETLYISEFMDELTRFAQKNDVLVNLVVHRTKQKDGEELTAYSTSGSHHFNDKTDYMYSIKRDLNTNIIEFKTLKIKQQKNLGSLGSCSLQYDWKSGNYFDAMSESNELIDSLFEENIKLNKINN